MTEKTKSISVLTMNTLAFTACFACWMMNGVLVTFLADNGLYAWNQAQIGWLIGTPVLTGSLLRLPVGVLTDKYGGRPVFAVLMLLSAGALYLISFADGFAGFFLGSLGFGTAGASFAVGIAYTSVWFKQENQGTALGVFGAGNAGSALTSLGAPILLKYLTDDGAHLEGWRQLPRLYAVALLAMTVLFWLFTFPKKADSGRGLSLTQRLRPLRELRVWRFGLYYFYVFGGFVALAQWLIPYYVNVYTMSIATAGMMTSIFSLPSGVIRALGGWLSDKFGARRIMYWVFGTCLACSALLIVPRMEIYSPGAGVSATAKGVVTEAGEGKVVVGDKVYSYKPRSVRTEGSHDANVLVLPKAETWQEPVVVPGQEVAKKQLLAKGTTHIYFQANVWIFTALVFIIGIMMGIGKAAVYKYIPDYFPNQVGVVGGIVGVLGGLGGFFGPIVFGYLLKATGLWTTCWMFFVALILVCLVWMHRAIQKMMKERVPELMLQVEAKPGAV
ncbi:MAG: NarK/NasA family nitrate transporter [Deltaproteobacteria bacterium]|nr:NarK/NasA family nitrate transporter [Deltaproteobacteria bacterium]